jgi:lipoate-protein ligase A
MSHIDRLSSCVPKLGTQEALNLEKAMLENVVSGDTNAALSFWCAERSIVVPKRMQAIDAFDDATSKSNQDGWPVFIRNTGGDATPQGEGILNISYAYAVPPKHKPSIEEAYNELCHPISEFLLTLNAKPECLFVPGSFCDGKYNVGVAGKKIAGTAQRWGMRKDKEKTVVLFAHALILVGADITSGTSAINRLYQYCGRKDRVTPSAHTNISDLVPTTNEKQLINKLAAFLQVRYTKLLHKRLADLSPPTTTL